MTDRAVVFVCGKDPLAEISGGHSHYVRAHAHAAIAAGYEPHLFCVGSSPSVSESGFGVVHRVRSLPPYRQIGVPWHAGILARAIRRAFPVCPVIHSFGLWGWAGVLAARARGPRGAPVRTIVNMYTAHPEESKSQVRSLDRDSSPLRARLSYRSQALWSVLVLARWERRMLHESDRVVVNYESVRRLLESRYGSLPNGLRLPYGPESVTPGGGETARPPAVPGSPFRILCVARHESRKGIRVLLDALARMDRSGASFRARLVGAGPLLDSHRRLARRLAIDDRVEIVGALPEIGGELRDADVLVLPSLEEQSGSMALLEAMQAGLPAVVSGVDGLLEDVEAERSALVVPPGDAAALAGAIERLRCEPALRLRISRGASEAYRLRFEPRHLADALGRLYAEMAGQDTPRSQGRRI